MLIGYAATIATKDGKVSYKGTDHMSGGYPYFSESPAIRDSMIEAIKDSEELKRMSGYYGSNKVNFEEVKVHRVILEEVVELDVDKEFQTEVLKKANKLLSKRELEALSKMLK
jgi:hypothetical protein